MARRIEFIVDVDSDGAVRALRQVEEGAEEAGEGMQELGQEGQQAGQKASVSMRGLGDALGAVVKVGAAAAAAVAAVGAAVVQMAASNDEIAKMAAVLGTTAEELQIVTGALGLGGVSAGQAAGAIRGLNRRLGEAATRGGPAAEALERLGLSAQELERLPLVERFALLADRLGDVESQSLRTLTAQNLLGGSGVQLLAAFQNGGEAIRQAAGAIERAGIVSNETAAESEALTDQVTLLSASFSSFTRDFLEPLIPIVQAVAAELTELIQVARRYTSAADEMSQRGLNAERVDVYSQALRRAEEELHALMAAAAEAQSRQDFAGMERLAQQMEEAQEKIVTFRELQDQARGSFREYAQEAREATEAVEEETEATTQEVAAVEELNEALKEASKLKIEVGDKTEELTQKSAEAAAAIVAEADALREAADKEQEAEQVRQDQRVQLARDTARNVVDVTLSALNEIRAAEAQALADRLREEEAAGDRVQEIQQKLSDATSERSRERLRAELATARQSEEIAREQALAAFRRGKALAIAQATISTAQAVAGALSSPPFPPVTIPAAIAAGALGAIQIGAIASEPAPSFHSGGLLRDEMMIRARAGEAVLSPSGVQSVGGADGVRAINQGQGGGPTTLIVEQKIRTQVLDSQAYDLGRSGRGALQNQIRRGRPKPGAHRPAGMG